MSLKSYVLNKESTKSRCCLQSVHKLRGPSTKSPSTQLVSSTSHVFWRVNRAKGQRENLVSSTSGRSSTIVLNVIKMMSPAKGPQTQLVSSTSHVFYELHRAKGQRGISCLLQGVRNRIECHQNDVSCEG